MPACSTSFTLVSTLRLYPAAAVARQIPGRMLLHLRPCVYNHPEHRLPLARLSSSPWKAQRFCTASAACAA